MRLFLNTTQPESIAILAFLKYTNIPLDLEYRNEHKMTLANNKVTKLPYLDLNLGA